MTIRGTTSVYRSLTATASLGTGDKIRCPIAVTGEPGIVYSVCAQTFCNATLGMYSTRSVCHLTPAGGSLKNVLGLLVSGLCLYWFKV